MQDMPTNASEYPLVLPRGSVKQWRERESSPGFGPRRSPSRPKDQWDDELRETPAVNADGRTFRRFLAQDVQAGAVVRVEPPRALTVNRERVYFSVGAVMIAGMLMALVYGMRRRVPRAIVGATAESASRRLVREIAELDDAFERDTTASEQARVEYEARRASLKSELAHVLAAERRSS